jgi:hypothetical protein
VISLTQERPLPTAGLAPTVLRQRADAFAVAWHPQRMQLAVALADGSCSLWDALGGTGVEPGRKVEIRAILY